MRIVRKAVGTIASNSTSFDQARELGFVQAMERAYFFFGDDVDGYLRQLWADITDIRTADAELQGTPDNETRRKIIEKAPGSHDSRHSIPFYRASGVGFDSEELP
jgi:hypothetical protein